MMRLRITVSGLGGRACPVASRDRLFVRVNKRILHGEKTIGRYIEAMAAMSVRKNLMYFNLSP